MLKGDEYGLMEIIKDSFVFPSKNIKLLLIFELLSIIAGAFSVIGTIDMC